MSVDFHCCVVEKKCLDKQPKVGEVCFFVFVWNEQRRTNQFDAQPPLLLKCASTCVILRQEVDLFPVLKVYLICCEYIIYERYNFVVLDVLSQQKL